MSLKFTVFDKNNSILFYAEKISEGWKPPYKITSATKFYFRVEAETPSGRKIEKCGEVLALTCIPKDVDPAKLNFEDKIDAFHTWSLQTSEHLSTCN